jgi:peptide deformylase
MTVRPIRIFGDPVLREPAQEVVDFDRELRRLVADLTETLRSENGAGLAAPQIGVGLRTFVFNVEGSRGHLVNPVLDFPDAQEQDGPEGCLSIPGLYYDTRRRLNVVARGFDEHGRPTQLVGTAELSRCLQHETDHLDGVLFLDRMDKATRRQALRDIRRAPWSSPDTQAPAALATVTGGQPVRPERMVRWSPHPMGGRDR